MTHLPDRPLASRETLLHGHLEKGWGRGAAISGDDRGGPWVSRETQIGNFGRGRGVFQQNGSGIS